MKNIKNIAKSFLLAATFFFVHYVAQYSIALAYLFIKTRMDEKHGVLQRGEGNIFIYNGKEYTETALKYIYQIKAQIPALILTGIFLIIFYFIVFKIFKSDFPEFIKMERRSFKQNMYGLYLGITAYFPIVFIISNTFIRDLSPETEKIFESIIMNSSMPMKLLGMGILGPIIEEITFRGLIYRSFRKSMHYIPAVVIQGLLFGILHGNAQQFIYTSLLGVIFGLICEWSNSILPAIFAHIGFNSFSLIINEAITSYHDVIGENVFALIYTLILFFSLFAFPIIVQKFYKNRNRSF